MLAIKAEKQPLKCHSKAAQTNAAILPIYVADQGMLNEDDHSV